jgi:streptomycin 6-kinase
MQNWYKTLSKHVIGAWEQQGEQWLERLPAIIRTLEKKWDLKNIKPIDFPSYNYVAFCDQKPGLPMVLKISCDAQLIADEYKTHQHFNGQGAIRVFAYDDQLHAVLLERAVPGDVLKALDRDQAVNIYAGIIKQLQSCEQKNLETYQTSDQWLKTIDRIEDNCLLEYSHKAQQLIDFFSVDPVETKICHADLHCENIILHGKKYFSIDPKGVVGELAFEASAFDLLTAREIKDNTNIDNIIQNRIQTLSEKLECDYQRLLAWFYLRSLISAQWLIEDQGDLSERLVLLKCLNGLI